MIVIRKETVLDAPIAVEALTGFTFSAENRGHQFIISCTRGGMPVPLSGSVSARFVRANGTTILIAGDGAQLVDGNAVITLHQDCYNVPGRFHLYIFNSTDSDTTCIYSCTGTVQRTQVGDLIDSGDVVPSLDDVIAKQAELAQDVADASSAIASAQNAVSYLAPGFSTLKTYEVGEYVTQDGALYICTTAVETAGAWDAAKWQAVTFGEEVADLKSAVTNAEGDIDALQTAVPGKVSKPVSSPNGTNGQLLRTNGDGTTTWVDQGLPTDAQTAKAVYDWLNDHPEATTTVQDHSLTRDKLVKGTLGFVMPEMYGAVGDGVTDDTAALQACLVNGNNVLLTKTYLITSTLDINYKHDISVWGGTITRRANESFNTIRGRGAYNITFENVIFDGNGNDSEFVEDWPDASQVCIFIGSQSKNISLTGCRISNYFSGVFILGADGDSTSYNGVIRDCVFHNCHKPIDTYGKNLLIDHNTFYGNTGYTIQIEPNGTAESDNPPSDENYYMSSASVVISNNLFVDNGYFDIKVFNNDYGVTITSNTFINYTQAVITTLNDKSRGICIANNILLYQKRQTITDKRPWSYSPAIYARGMGVTVSNNHIYHPIVGICISDAADVSNNIIYKPEISGIVVSDVESTTNFPAIKTIRGNVITGHTLATGAWWASFAIVIGSVHQDSVYVISDNVVESTSRPIYIVPGYSAYVNNLLSSTEQSAITKPEGLYSYSN